MIDTDRSDKNAELALLSACLQSKVAREEARRHITGADFDHPSYEVIWDAMGKLDRAGNAVDFVSVNGELDAGGKATMLEVATAFGVPDNVSTYARTVRSWATKRRLEMAAAWVMQRAMSPELEGAEFAAKAATRFAALRDDGNDDDGFTGLLVSELLEHQDDEPEWLIPGLLERRDRFMLTGDEGLGKSHFLRQMALFAAAGLHPFTLEQIQPVRALIVDCENTWSQVRRKVRPVVEFATNRGQDPTQSVMVDCTSRMDITRDKDLSRIHHMMDAFQPDIVVIGPLYRLVPRALQTDDDTAPVLAALDTIRDRGASLLMEAHAGHVAGGDGNRNLRPRGSSSLLGWPEFGYGMRGVAGGVADLVPWRGQREERNWPGRMKHAPGHRWAPHD